MASCPLAVFTPPNTEPSPKHKRQCVCHPGHPSTSRQHHTCSLEGFDRHELAPGCIDSSPLSLSAPWLFSQPPTPKVPCVSINMSLMQCTLARMHPAPLAPMQHSHTVIWHASTCCRTCVVPIGALQLIKCLNPIRRFHTLPPLANMAPHCWYGFPPKPRLPTHANGVRNLPQQWQELALSCVQSSGTLVMAHTST